jgi:hypothetical protein
MVPRETEITANPLMSFHGMQPVAEALERRRGDEFRWFSDRTIDRSLVLEAG